MHKLSHFDTERSFLFCRHTPLTVGVFSGSKKKFYFDHDTTFYNPLDKLVFKHKVSKQRNVTCSYEPTHKKTRMIVNRNYYDTLCLRPGMFVRTLGIKGWWLGDTIPLFICFVLVLVAIKARSSFVST